MYFDWFYINLLNLFVLVWEIILSCFCRASARHRTVGYGENMSHTPHLRNRTQEWDLKIFDPGIHSIGEYLLMTLILVNTW